MNKTNSNSKPIAPTQFILLLAGLALLTSLSACTPSIHDLVGNAPLEDVKTLLDKNPEQVHDTTPLGQGPLHFAVMYKRIDLMQLLLDNGADINLADNTGMTPLHVCALYGRRDEAQWLLDHNANAEALDSFGDTPIHTAACFDQGGVIKILKDHGAPMNTQNAAGKTPLALARQHRSERTEKYIQKLLAQS